MGAYNPNTIEQEIALKDGRTIYKTHNGFQSWVKNAKGEATKVSDDYYKNAKKYRN